MKGPFKLRSGNATPFKLMGSSPVKQDKLKKGKLSDGTEYSYYGTYDALGALDKEYQKGLAIEKREQDAYDNKTIPYGDAGVIKQKYSSGSKAMTRAKINKKLHTHYLDKSGEFVIRPEFKGVDLNPGKRKPVVNPQKPTGPEYDM